MRGGSSIEDQADLAFVLERVAGDRDRRRRRLRAVKYRIDVEPPPLWLRMGMTSGALPPASPNPTRAVAMTMMMSNSPMSSSPPGSKP